MLPFKLTNKAREDLIGIARYTEKTWGRDQRRAYLKQLDEAGCGIKCGNHSSAAQAHGHGVALVG